jgi:hypothetical protein
MQRGVFIRERKYQIVVVPLIDILSNSFFELGPKIQRIIKI